MEGGDMELRDDNPEIERYKQLITRSDDPVFTAYLEKRIGREEIPVHEPDETVRDV